MISVGAGDIWTEADESYYRMREEEPALCLECGLEPTWQDEHCESCWLYNASADSAGAKP